MNLGFSTEAPKTIEIASLAPPSSTITIRIMGALVLLENSDRILPGANSKLGSAIFVLSSHISKLCLRDGIQRVGLRRWAAYVNGIQNF